MMSRTQKKLSGDKIIFYQFTVDCVDVNRKERRIPYTRLCRLLLLRCHGALKALLISMFDNKHPIVLEEKDPTLIARS